MTDYERSRRGTALLAVGFGLVLVAAVCALALVRVQERASKAQAAVRGLSPTAAVVINVGPVNRNRGACWEDSLVQTPDHRQYNLRFSPPPDCTPVDVGLSVLVRVDYPLPGDARPWKELVEIANGSRSVDYWYLAPLAILATGLGFITYGFRQVA